MRRLLFFASLILFSLESFSQTVFGKYLSKSQTFTIKLTQSEQQQIFDSIKVYLSYDSECRFDSLVINDPSPSTIDSAAYAVFYGRCGENYFSIGFYLTKEIDNLSGNDDIIYSITDEDPSALRAWKCEVNGNCHNCRPVRNWFLGPVVGCNCEECNFSTSSSGFPWPAVLGLLGVIITILTS